MTRTIKFRIWDKKRKEWVHDTAHAVNLLGEIIIMGEILRRPDDTSVTLAELNDLEVMQFTGLLDKNEVPIFEGDVVVDRFGNKSKVIWNGASFMLKEDTPVFLNQFFEIEVIGNVLEAPNLLTNIQ